MLGTQAKYIHAIISKHIVLLRNSSIVNILAFENGEVMGKMRLLAAAIIVVGITACGAPSSSADTPATTNPTKGWVTLWGGDRSPTRNTFYKRCDGHNLLYQMDDTSGGIAVVANSSECP